MNDLTIQSNLKDSFPTIAEGLQRAQKVFDCIQSFEDIERIFLRGQGLSYNTYRSYLTAVKQFYEFTDGLNPLQVTPAWIEMFYDHLVQKVDISTAHLRICGLKKFFAGIRRVVPFYTSPFEIMSETLKRKLRAGKKKSTVRVLSRMETNAVLIWLEKDQTLKGMTNKALVKMLLTSGLRAAELCSLRWRDKEEFDGKLIVRFQGKGGKEARQELYNSAVQATLKAFISLFKRKPSATDFLFYSLPAFPVDKPRPMTPHRLWVRIKEVGERAWSEGIIKRDITFTPHLFRRTYATLLYKSGMGLRAIQQKTRHASIETLMRHYIHDEESITPYFDKILGGVR